MRAARYGKIDKDIVSHDGGGIWDRWRYGRLLVVDDTATTAKGNLHHGVLDQLIKAAERHGIKVSEREIQFRLRCARSYPTESQIRNAVSDFKTWHDLVAAVFPHYEAPDGEPPYDPRSDAELSHDHKRKHNLLDHAGYGRLFDHLDPTTTTLAELERWTAEQEEITSRFVAIGFERRRHLDDLIKAVNGDVSVTLAEAEAALAATQS